jgi:hypothetical protein
MPYISNWDEVVHGFRRDIGKISKKIKTHTSVLTAQDVSDIAGEECPGVINLVYSSNGHFRRWNPWWATVRAIY